MYAICDMVLLEGLTMTVTKNTKEKYWHERAEAFRAMAEQTSDPASRSIAFNIAADLERLAEAAEGEALLPRCRPL
jgi:hypothetical protein